MQSIRARCGNTAIELNGSALRVEIAGDQFGPYAIDEAARSNLWARLENLAVPLALGAGIMGVGGLSTDVAIKVGGTHVQFGWWMAPPKGWGPLAEVFDALRALAPRELTSRYDFAMGGE